MSARAEVESGPPVRRLERPAQRLLLAAALLFVTWACDSGTAPLQEAATITVTPGSLTFDAIEDTRTLSAQILDRDGAPMDGLQVTWTSSDPAVALVSSAGVVTSTGNGTATITASSGSASRSVPVSVSQAPDALEVLEGAGQQATAGDAVTVRVRVTDRLSNPVQGRSVSFGVVSGGGSANPSSVLTGADGTAMSGWTLGPIAGSQLLLVSIAGAARLSTEVQAVAVEGELVPSLQKVSGDGQSAAPGSPLPLPLVVEVRDQFGSPMSQVPVEFTPGAGMGSVSPPSAMSAGNGSASTTWTLGPSPGPQQLTASVPGGVDVVFSATATTEGGPAGFSIEYEYVTAASPIVREAFELAAARWAQIIVEKLPEWTVTLPAGSQCGNPEEASRTVDDLHIFVIVASIDGPGGTLARAGPCAVRQGSQLPVAGLVRVDADDVNALAADGRLYDVVLHEVAHVLGFGTRWQHFGFLQNPSFPGQSGADTHFSGPAAIAAFDAVGGTGYAGSKVPVQNTGGQGTADSHWRTFIFGNELMIGSVGQSGLPISRVTVASLGDLGYAVSEGAADPYTLPGSGAQAAPAEDAIHLGDDLIRVPIRVLNQGGKVVRVIPGDDGSMGP